MHWRTRSSLLENPANVEGILEEDPTGFCTYLIFLHLWFHLIYEFIQDYNVDMVTFINLFLDNATSNVVSSLSFSSG
jgi:hypothetical protein